MSHDTTSFQERRRRHKIKISFIMEVVQLVVIARKDPSLVEARQNELVTRLNELLEQGHKGWSSVLFDDESVFVDGQVLCVEEALYARGLRIMQALTRLNIYEVQFEAPLTAYDVQRLLSYLMRQQPLASVEQTLSPRLRVRSKAASLLMSWDLSLDAGELCARVCATSLMVMQQFYDRALQGDLSALPYVKRVAQNLVVLTERHSAMLLAILGAQFPHKDVPSLALRSAVLVVVMMRRLTRDRRNTIDLVMSALLYDMGAMQLMREEHPVMSYRDAAQFASWSASPPAKIAPRLGVAAASMVTRLGEMGEASLARSIYVYESLEMTHMAQRQPAYPATLEAVVLTIARMFITHLAPIKKDPDLTIPSGLPGTQSRVDRAISEVMTVTTRRTERLVVNLLLEGLGLVAKGEKVKLSSGFSGVVVANHERPSCFSRPVVRVLRMPDGAAMRPARDVDLSLPLKESVELGAIAALIPEPDELLDQASARILKPVVRAPRPRLFDALGKKKKSFERVPKPVIALTPQVSEAPEDEFEEAVTQIRKAPEALSKLHINVASLVDETQEDLVLQHEVMGADETQDIYQEELLSLNANMSWDEGEDTSTSAPSDRIQMLKASDIAHMMPEELLGEGEGAVINQDFSVAPFMRKNVEVTASLDEDATMERISARDVLHSSIISLESFTSRTSSGPEDAVALDEMVSATIPSIISLNPETWDNLHEDLDEESSITGPASDRLIVLDGMPEEEDDDGEDGPQNTTLLPPNVVDALMSRDRRRHVFGASMVEHDHPPHTSSVEDEKSGK